MLNSLTVNKLVLKENKKEKNHGDYLLVIAVVLLAIIGCVFIYSASNYSARATYKDSFYFVKKQIIGIVLGVVAMLFTALVFNYKKLKKLNVMFSIISFVCLLLVFVPGIGVKTTELKDG